MKPEYLLNRGRKLLKKGNRYEPIYYFNHTKLPVSIINNTGDEYHRLIIKGASRKLLGLKWADVFGCHIDATQW